jgi:phage repressor protein C with HTH and peptisase S24 domain
MLTHDTIWLAIDRLAQSAGYSTSGLAKKSGLDPTAFNRSKRIGPDGKPRWPSTESIARILTATQSTMADFIALIDMQVTGSKPQQMIPVLRYAEVRGDSHFDMQGHPTGDKWDMIHFPHPNGEPQPTFALEVTDDSLLPIFRSGDRLVIVPGAAVRRGDRVIAHTQSGEFLARELVRQTAGKIELKSLTGRDENLSYSAKDVRWVARILWVSQ